MASRDFSIDTIKAMTSMISPRSPKAYSILLNTACAPPITPPLKAVPRIKMPKIQGATTSCFIIIRTMTTTMTAR